MKILAINGSYRKEGTTTRLTQKALDGAASEGAQTQMVLLDDKDVRYCRNCLTCYKDLTSRIAPCIIQDDVREILEAIGEADGIFFSSPVHVGFVSAIMTAFIERATFTLMRPTGEIMGFKGMPEPRLTDKARPIATIVSAGGVPTEMRHMCDLGSPWLQESASSMCNGQCIGDLYAGAVLTRELEGKEWNQAMLFRELTEAQLQEAYDLGRNMVRIIKEGKSKPFDPAQLIKPAEG